MSTETNEKPKTIAYLSVSTEQGDLNSQKLELQVYACRNNLAINDFIEIEISSQKNTHARRIDELMTYLREGDLLLVNELSKLGRSAGQIIQIIDALIKENVHFAAIKESITINCNQDMQTKTIISMFALFAKIERDLISERTKQALRRAKEKGKQLGRPKGSGKSKLDEFKPEIEALLKNGSSKTFISKRYGTSLTNFYKWMRKHHMPLN